MFNLLVGITQGYIIQLYIFKFICAMIIVNLNSILTSICLSIRRIIIMYIEYNDVYIYIVIFIYYFFFYLVESFHPIQELRCSFQL